MVSQLEFFTEENARNAKRAALIQKRINEGEDINIEELTDYTEAKGSWH
jgi:hypothetical protein